MITVTVDEVNVGKQFVHAMTDVHVDGLCVEAHVETSQKSYS